MTPKVSINQLVQAIKDISTRPEKQQISDRDSLLYEHFQAVTRESLISFQPLLFQPDIIELRYGKKRNVLIPDPINNALQQLILELTIKTLPAPLPQSCYSQSGTSLVDAIRHIQDAIISGRIWLVKVDIEKFFDNIDHQTLFRILKRKRYFTKKMRLLILKCLHIPENSTGKGLPMGCPLSPLLANIYLADLTQELEDKRYWVYQYFDDIGVLCSSRQKAEKVQAKLIEYLKVKRKLDINRSKTSISRVWRTNILGYELRKGKKGKVIILPSQDSIRHLEDTILSHINIFLKTGNFTLLLNNVNDVLRGWANAYRIISVGRTLKQLDEWMLQALIEAVIYQRRRYPGRFAAFRILFKTEGLVRKITGLSFKSIQRVLEECNGGIRDQHNMVSLYSAVTKLKRKDAKEKEDAC